MDMLGFFMKLQIREKIICRNVSPNFRSLRKFLINLRSEYNEALEITAAYVHLFRNGTITHYTETITEDTLPPPGFIIEDIT